MQPVNGMCNFFGNPFLSYEEMDWQQPDLAGMGASQLIWRTTVHCAAVYGVVVVTQKVVLPLLRKAISYCVNRRIPINNDPNVQFWRAADKLGRVRSVFKKVANELKNSNPKTYQAFRDLIAYKLAHMEIESIEKGTEIFNLQNLHLLEDIADLEIWDKDPIGLEKLNNYLNRFRDHETDPVSYCEEFHDDEVEVEKIVRTLESRHPDAFKDIREQERKAMQDSYRQGLQDRPKVLGAINKRLQILFDDPNSMSNYKMYMKIWRSTYSEIMLFLNSYSNELARYDDELTQLRNEARVQELGIDEFMFQLMDFLVERTLFQPLEDI